MIRKRHLVKNLILVLALVALGASSLPLAAADGPPRTGSAKRAPTKRRVTTAHAAPRRITLPFEHDAVELVETVPIETRLGNPSLRQARDVWPEMFRSAKRSIDVEGFYMSTWPREPLVPVLRALGDAARRGVRVRLLFDRGMSATYPKPLDSLATVPGFEVRRIDMRRIAGGVQHAKYFLIDDEQVFVGSQNFDWRSLSHVHELGVRVHDRRVAQAFGEVFAWDWGAADTTTWREREIAASGRRPAGMRKLPEPPVQNALAVPIPLVQALRDTVYAWPSYSPKGWIPDTTRFDLDAIVALIDRAQLELVLQLLTYSPEEYGETDSTLDQALRRAAARGVEVKLLISDWEVNGKGIGWLQRLSQLPNVRAKLSTLPDWSGGYIPFARVEHCKYVVVDTAVVWIGTANWGPGYFYGSRNLALTLENRRLAEQARRVFESAWGATSAAAVRADFNYPEKIRGEKPPPGTRRVYGN